MSSFVFLFSFCPYTPPKKSVSCFLDSCILNLKLEPAVWCRRVSTQEVGGSKSASLLRSPGTCRTALYHRNEQTLQVFLCPEFESKTNLGTGFLRELWNDTLAMFVRNRKLCTIQQNTIEGGNGKSAMEDVVGFLTETHSCFCSPSL